MQNLEDLIKNSRLKKNLSQRALAKLMEVDNSYIAKLETGKINKPSESIIIKLAKVLDLDILELLEAANYKKHEIYELTHFAADLNFDYKALLITNNEELKRYTIENDAGIFLDILAILEDYKKEKISKEKAVQLLHLCEPLQSENKYIYFSKKGSIEIENSDI